MVDAPLTPEQPGNPLGHALSMTGVQSPNGDYFITITHQGPLMSFSYGIPLDAADTVADDYANNLKKLAADLRRVRSGLVVAGVDAPAVMNRDKEAARRASRNGRTR